MPEELRSFTAGALIRGSGLRHRMVSGKADLSDAEKVRPTDWNDEHIGSTEWGVVKVKSADQSVINSTTVVDDTELNWPVNSGELWRFEIVLVYEATTACDFKFDLAISSGTMVGWWRYAGSDTTANAILVSTGVRYSAVANATAVAAGGQGAGLKASILIEGIVRADATGVMKFRFAQNTQTSGVSAITKAGSTLKAKKLSS